MSATNVAFKCGSCGNLLSIGEELRGQVVRCPFCQQVIQVPASELAPAAGPTLDPAIVPAEPPVVTAAAPDVTPAHDGPHWGDLLGTPHLAAVGNVAASPAADPQHQAWGTGATTEMLMPGPAVALGDGEPTLELSAPPQEARPAPAAPANGDMPWTSAGQLEALDSSATATAPAPAAAKPARRLSRAVWALSVLIPYSLTVTAAVVFLLTREKPVHPLESIQDQGLYEDIAFDGVRREPVPNSADLKEARKPDKISPLYDLPPWFPRVKLGETRQFGGIEVTPLEVSRQKLRFLPAAAEPQAATAPEALILKLRIKNVSNLIFHPNDVTFNRDHKKDVYTFLEIGGSRFYGALKDPWTERLQGQNAGELLPEGEMETAIIAFQSDKQQQATAALAAARPDELLTWRVHLRKGREEVRLRQGGRRTLWATTIVAVTFTPAAVKPAAAGNR